MLTHVIPSPSGSGPGSDHSPLEGESARQGHSQQPSRWGDAERAKRVRVTGSPSPHRISLRLTARLLRLPLKGGVMTDAALAALQVGLAKRNPTVWLTRPTLLGITLAMGGCTATGTSFGLAGMQHLSSGRSCLWTPQSSIRTGCLRNCLTRPCRLLSSSRFSMER